MTDQKVVTVQELAQARKEAEEAQVEFDLAESKLAQKASLLPESSAAHNAKIRRADALAKATDLEAAYKEQLLAEHKATGEKKFDTLPGGSVSVNKKLEYDDVKVIGWLRDHNFNDLIFYSYKKSDVKKLHSDKTPVDGITVTENPVAKIEKDLSKYLEE
jgi:hypothetical protein